MSSSRRRSLCLVGGALVVSTLLLTACESTYVFRVEQKVTRKELEQGGMAMAAVTALGGGEYAAADVIAARIEEQCREARPRLTIVPVAEVKAGFNVQTYGQTLKTASEGLAWRAEDLAASSALTNRVRYMLVLDIEGSAERRRKFEHEQFEWFGSETVSKATRSVELVFTLNDLWGRLAVWTAHGEATLTAKASAPSGSRKAADLDAGTPSIPETVEALAPEALAKLP